MVNIVFRDLEAFSTSYACSEDFENTCFDPNFSVQVQLKRGLKKTFFALTVLKNVIAIVWSTSFTIFSELFVIVHECKKFGTRFYDIASGFMALLNGYRHCYVKLMDESKPYLFLLQ